MADESRLRVGGWVGAHGGPPGHRPMPEHPPEWDAAEDFDLEAAAGKAGSPTVEWEPAPAEPEDDDYRGHRRRDERVAPRRLVGVAIAVGALLIGVGVMARSLSPDPTTLPAPPETPEHAVEEVAPTGGTARLGVAPTPSPEAVSGPGPAPTPPGAEGPPGGDSPGPTPPTPTTPPTTPPIVSYESEAAGLGNHTRVRSHPGASGGEVVEFTSGSPRASIEHPDVTVAASGTYRLTIHYFGTRGHGVLVSVNGGPSAPVDLPGQDDGDTAGAVTLSVDLDAGANTVLIRTNDGPGGQIDRISIADG